MSSNNNHHHSWQRRSGINVLNVRRELEQEVAAQDIIQTLNKYEQVSTDNCSAVHSFKQFILKSVLSHSSKVFMGL